MKSFRITAAIIWGALVLSGLANPGVPGQILAEVTGNVSVFEPGSSQPMKDASQVVVWLVPADPSNPPHLNPEKSHYRMLQHNKMFEPNFLVVPLGSVVDFPNLDPWFHNVFSLYRGKRFDLGLYQAGAQRTVTFDRPGPSFLFCNIHPQMTAVIMAVESDLFAVSNKAGFISIVNVPPGKYVLHVWHADATPDTIHKLQRTIRLGATDNTLPLISIQITKRDKSPHKDKYGRDYDPNGASPPY
jgi:plastocyanin